jgi:hypothetical protein
MNPACYTGKMPLAVGVATFDRFRCSREGRFRDKRVIDSDMRMRPRYL